MEVVSFLGYNPSPEIKAAFVELRETETKVLKGLLRHIVALLGGAVLDDDLRQGLLRHETLFAGLYELVSLAVRASVRMRVRVCVCVCMYVCMCMVVAHLGDG